MWNVNSCKKSRVYFCFTFKFLTHIFAVFFTATFILSFTYLLYFFQDNVNGCIHITYIKNSTLLVHFYALDSRHLLIFSKVIHLLASTISFTISKTMSFMSHISAAYINYFLFCIHSTSAKTKPVYFSIEKKSYRVRKTWNWWKVFYP